MRLNFSKMLQISCAFQNWNQKLRKKVLILEIIVFELVAVSYPYY